MKKILCILLTAALVLAFAACSGRTDAETALSLAEIAETIRESDREMTGLTSIHAADEEFETWLTYYYELPLEQVADGVILYADGGDVREIAVLLLTDTAEPDAIETALREYIQSRADTFEGYAPQQAAMARAGTAAVNGRYAALMICPDPQTAKAAFLSCFGGDAGGGATGENGTPPPENSERIASPAAHEQAGAAPGDAENSHNGYDTSAVLTAWRTGDDSALTETDRAILDAAKGVIEATITDEMIEYEKELAIHDYITEHSRFDYGVFGRSADGLSDGSDTPYGVLVNQSAMCHGYSSTFQLFMEMLDIECLTVFGEPTGSGMQHSWNMVRLDGAWYCVDCAWDDPIGGSPNHGYFNVTSETLRRGSIHRWDESSVPEATGTKYAYGNHEP